jgi:O-antigen ligase
MSEDNTTGEFGSWRQTWALRLERAAVALLLLFTVLLMNYGWRKGGQTAALLALVCALAARILRPRRSSPVDSIEQSAMTRWQWVFVGGLVSFLAVNVLAILLSDELPGMGTTNTGWTHGPGIVVALAFLLATRREALARRFVGTLLVCAGVWYAYELASHLWRWPYADGRFAGSRGFHTYVAMELLLLLSLYAGHAIGAKNRRVVAASSVGALLVGAFLFLANTRFTLVAMATVTLPAMLLLQKRLGNMRRRAVLAAVWLFVILPIGALVWWGGASEERLSARNASTRVGAWKVALQIAGRSPARKLLIGHGRYRRVFPAAAEAYGIDTSAWQGERLAHAHSLFLQTLVETGLVGVVALIAVFVSAIVCCAKSWRLRDPPDDALCATLLVVLASALAMGMMDYSLHFVAGEITWMVLGVAAARRGGPACVCGPTSCDEPNHRSRCAK